MKLKFITSSLLTTLTLFVTSQVLAAVPNLQIQCNTLGKSQHDFTAQLENGFVYESLQVKTINARASAKLAEAELQGTSVQRTFTSPVKSVTLTYQDPETSSAVAITEDVQCAAPVADVIQNEVQTVPAENFSMPLQDAEALLTELNTLSAQAVEAVVVEPIVAEAVIEPEKAVVENVVTPAFEPSATTAAEILPTDEPETSAQILGIESALPTNPKKRLGAQNSKKKASSAASDEVYDFSEDIEDF